MKRLSFSINFIFLFLISSAQISTREISTQEIARPVLYDSTYFGYRDFLIQGDIKQYIGQEIYLLPISKVDTNKHYSDFFYKLQQLYNPNDLTNELNKYKINYDSIKNQKLLILDADFISLSRNEWYLKLLFKQKDTIFYVAPYQVYYYQSIQLLPFIMNAFLEKSKRIFLKSTFIVNHELSTFDINSREKLSLKEGERWICDDITLLDLGNWNIRYSMPSLILKNSKGNEIFVNFAKRYDLGFKEEELIFFDRSISPTIDDFYTIDQFRSLQIEEAEKNKLELAMIAKVEEQKQSIIRKFGDYFGKLINNHKVVIGMSKNMCELSWGKPFRKDELTTETGKYEMWQYDYKTFLYFEGDKLKIIKQ
jgi:hypothetical protein